MDPVHVRPTAPLAPRVLLPGDPARALLISQTVLDAPKMFNHNRGLWGYTGRAADGELLTVQSTGMGGASTAIVVEELIALGAERLVRVGTTGALDADLGLGDLVVAREALAEDGASRGLGAADRVPGDPGLTEALETAAGRPAGTVVSTDLFYSRDAAAEARARARWRSAGAIAVEMETATLFTLAALRRARAGCVLAVSDVLADDAGRGRIGDVALEQAGRRLGDVALAALAER
jgi:DeoD family purine-nucleoside phosphorylase